MNYLGIDWGRSKVGLATGSSGVSIASPYKTIRYKSSADLMQEIEAIVKEEQVDKVIIGRPVSLSGDVNMAQDFSLFVEGVKSFNVDVSLVDERFSTKEAQNLMRQTGSKDDDVIAATLILQTFLDKRKHV